MNINLCRESVKLEMLEYIYKNENVYVCEASILSVKENSLTLLVHQFQLEGNVNITNTDAQYNADLHSLTFTQSAFNSENGSEKIVLKLFDRVTVKVSVLKDVKNSRGLKLQLQITQPLIFPLDHSDSQSDRVTMATLTEIDSNADTKHQHDHKRQKRSA